MKNLLLKIPLLEVVFPLLVLQIVLEFAALARGLVRDLSVHAVDADPAHLRPVFWVRSLPAGALLADREAAKIAVVREGAYQNFIFLNSPNFSLQILQLSRLRYSCLVLVLLKSGSYIF